MKTLVILQGIPGCGKSWMADTLQREQPRGEAVIYSTDEFWYSADGRYNYDPEKITDAHVWNQSRAQESMIWSFPLIIIDNTNIKREHAQPYLNLAQAFGYAVQVVRVECPLEVAIARNLERPVDRQVPPAVIIRMYAQMERLV